MKKLFIYLAFTVMALSTSAKDRFLIAATHSPSVKNTTIMAGSSINTFAFGIIGEDTFKEVPWAIQKQCLYVFAGKHFFDRLLISPLIGVGRSFNNTRTFQYGGLITCRISVINIGMMFNTTTKYSFVIGVAIPFAK